MYGAREVVKVGEFEVGNKIFVSDPCYERVEQSNRSSAVVSVKPGKWISEVDKKDEGTWGIRIAELRAYAPGHRNFNYWEWYGTCGVDSGQLGFFDHDKYPIGVNGYTAEYNDPDNWYKKACNETRYQKWFGIVEGMGVNSSSGFGDGSYDIFVARDDNGDIVGIKAVFINEDDDND